MLVTWKTHHATQSDASALPIGVRLEQLLFGLGSTLISIGYVDAFEFSEFIDTFVTPSVLGKLLTIFCLTVRPNQSCVLCKCMC